MKPFFEDPFLQTTTPGVCTEIPPGRSRPLQTEKADGEVDSAAGEEPETRLAPFTVVGDRPSSRPRTRN